MYKILKNKKEEDRVLVLTGLSGSLDLFTITYQAVAKRYYKVGKVCLGVQWTLRLGPDHGRLRITTQVFSADQS